MTKASHAALFASVCVGMGILFGVYIAFFARKYAEDYADHELVKSRKLRTMPSTPSAPNEITFVEDWKSK